MTMPRLSYFAAALPLALFGLAACAAKPAPASSSPAVPAKPAASASSYDIHLQRGACFGRCPQYTLRIADGAVEFVGARFVASGEEPQKGVPDAAALASLLSTLGSPEIASLLDIYRPGQRGCGQMATDMPSSRMEWTIDGRHQQINLYQGCQGAPAALRALPAAIDAAAGSQRWIEQGVDR